MPGVNAPVHDRIVKMAVTEYLWSRFPVLPSLPPKEEA